MTIPLTRQMQFPLDVCLQLPLCPDDSTIGAADTRCGIVMTADRTGIAMHTALIPQDVSGLQRLRETEAQTGQRE